MWASEGVGGCKLPGAVFFIFLDRSHIASSLNKVMSHISWMKSTRMKLEACFGFMGKWVGSSGNGDGDAAWSLCSAHEGSETNYKFLACTPAKVELMYDCNIGKSFQVCLPKDG